MCMQGLADLQAIADAISKSGITQVELGLEEFKQVGIHLHTVGISFSWLGVISSFQLQVQLI